MTPPTDETPAAPQPSGDALPPDRHTQQEEAPQPDADPRGTRVAEAVKAWQRHLVDLGGRNTLLWYRDLPSGTLDLTHRPPRRAGHAAGRPPDPALRPGPRARLPSTRPAAGPARSAPRPSSCPRSAASRPGSSRSAWRRWTVRGAVARPGRAGAAAVLRAQADAAPPREDFDLDLGNDVEFNPVLEHYLRSEQGLDLDTGALEELANAERRLRPAPRVCRAGRALRVGARSSR